MKQPIYNTALYLRLSRDDEGAGESNSIATQRMMLRRYAEQNSLYIVDEYIDDGYSGTNFNRPNFQRMIGDIEAGRINCVVVKDLSRFGRNYLEMGMYTEMRFPELGVRFIAVDSGVDSNNQQSTEFTPFLNVINEWYARDISRKVTKAMRTRFENGAHYAAHAPLGYRKDPEQVGHLLVDDETKWIVEKIYALAVQGAGASKITHILAAEQIPTPSWLNFQRYGTFARIHEGQAEEKRYAWSICQVQSILRDETYIGNSVHNKRANVSFKCKKLIHRPKEEWFTVENTHEAIISKADFDRVQKQIASRRRQRKNGTTQIFAGLVKCADCGWSMSYGVHKGGKAPFSYFQCTKYGQGLHQCTIHYVRYDVLYAYVLSRLQYWSGLVQHDEERLLKQLLNATDKGQAAARKKQAAELKKAEKRKAEVDTLFARMYEDWAAGRITEYNFSMLSGKYQSEQAELDEKIEQLQSAIATESQNAVDAEKWIALMKECVNPTELTAELLNMLIEKIVVHEAVKGEDGSREQEVEIFYRFIGKID